MLYFNCLGNVYAISLNTRIDAEDCISITNSNLLQMSLIQSSYQNICLPVKDSSKFIFWLYLYIFILNLYLTWNSKVLLFFLFKEITLDLKELKFSSKSYQRIKESFERFQTKFDMLVCWESNSKQLFVIYWQFIN